MLTTVTWMPDPLSSTGLENAGLAISGLKITTVSSQ